MKNSDRELELLKALKDAVWLLRIHSSHPDRCTPKEPYSMQQWCSICSMQDRAEALSESGRG